MSELDQLILKLCSRGLCDSKDAIKKFIVRVCGDGPYTVEHFLQKAPPKLVFHDVYYDDSRTAYRDGTNIYPRNIEVNYFTILSFDCYEISHSDYEDVYYSSDPSPDIFDRQGTGNIEVFTINRAN